MWGVRLEMHKKIDTLFLSICMVFPFDYGSTPISEQYKKITILRILKVANVLHF